MLRITDLVLISLFCGALASPSIVDFQEQFSDLSRGFKFVLQEYRVKNGHLRSEVSHRILDALGNLTVEMRDITADYWAQIVAHEYATPECLELIGPDFDYYVVFGAYDIQVMASEMDRFMREDAYYRFNPVISYAQRENNRAVYQTVQTLGRNQFLANMVDTMYELQEELEYYQNVRGTFQEMLDKELERVDALRYRVEENVEWWHDFTVRWHHIFMGNLLIRVDYYCHPDAIGTRGTVMPLGEEIGAKLKEVAERKAIRGVKI